MGTRRRTLRRRHRPRAAFALVDAGNVGEIIAYLKANVGLGRRPEDRRRHGRAGDPAWARPARQTLAMHCEVAQRFAAWLDSVRAPGRRSTHVFERWDGHGFPGFAWRRDPAAGADPAHSARRFGVPLGRRAGGAPARCRESLGWGYDPCLAGLAAQHPRHLAELDETRMWDQALGGRAVSADLDRRRTGRHGIRGHRRVHRPQVAVASRAFDRCGGARRGRGLASGHAGGVRYRLCTEPPSHTTSAASACRTRSGRSRAPWVRGVGARATAPAFTERAFAQSAALAPIGILAGAHHERLDGSGYHRGTRGPGLDRSARILAAADCYAAMCEARPYRPARDAPEAAAELILEVMAGRLDRDAVDAVLAAAGHRVHQRPPELPAGLTDRELEVLLVLSRQVEPGDRRAAWASHQDRRTPCEHVYRKAGVRSRAAATLWAFEHDLVHTAQ